ncbi:MAG: CHAP domain-containing protein [Eubacterium sp.]|nr:CHAP domain-containing protein [Eubacterium sp.]
MIKILKKGILAVIMTALILTLSPLTAFSQEYKPRLTAPRGEPYYTSKLNVYSQTGYGMPNCVAYAYGRLYELNGEAPKLNRGDAGQWWSMNKRNGYYKYGDVAERGAVACWSNHVAIVEEINNDGSITVSESHWGGNYFNTKTYYNMSSHYGQRFYGYIYAYTPKADDDEEVDVDVKSNETATYSFEDSYFEPQEKTAFSALEFKQSDNKIMNPNNNLILNPKQ